MKRALIVGCGYTGRRLGARLARSGVEVVGTTRRSERASELGKAGIEPLVGAPADEGVLREIAARAPEAVFYLVPPQPDPDPQAAVIRALGRAPLEAWVYASSTSVYGDRGGDWVDETTSPRPITESARDREAAERRLLELAWEHDAPVRIGRIAGIYGPGRTLRDRLSSGDYHLIRGRDTHVNRIHLDDLVEGLIAMARHGTTGRIYNLTDDHPHGASEFARLAAELHGLPAPGWIDEAEARERYGAARLARKTSDKRVSNLRLREELKVELRYPTFREGLPAAVSEERRRAYG